MFVVPFLLAASLIGTSPAYVVSLFQPAIDTEPNLSYLFWNAGPSIDDLRLVAEEEHRDGQVGLQCSIERSGRLKRCQVVERLGPANFGSAALRLSRRFLMKPQLTERARSAHATIYISLPFCASRVCDPPEWRHEAPSAK
jgi:TonB family protein